jgi:hypothetical protein
LDVRRKTHDAKLGKKDGRRAQILSVRRKLLYEIYPWSISNLVLSLDFAVTFQQSHFICSYAFVLFKCNTIVLQYPIYNEPARDSNVFLTGHQTVRK